MGILKGGPQQTPLLAQTTFLPRPFFGHFLLVQAPKRGAPKGGAPKGGAPKGGAPKGGAPKGGAPKGVVPKGVGPEGWAEPKISRFFCPLPPPCSFFFFSLGIFSCLFSFSLGVFSYLFFSLGGRFVEFGGVIDGQDPQMCLFGVLGLSCEAPAAHDKEN